MAALDTVQNYVDAARVLLQDTVATYRYSDLDLVSAMNMGILEARRLRPDLFLGRFSAIPSYSSGTMSASVVFDNQYRVSLVYYMCGQAQLRDEEATQDGRAAVFLNKFLAQLQTIQA